jgi:hypothetical protein
MPDHCALPFKDESIAMLDNNTAFTHYLKKQFNATSRWRSRQAVRFPDDRRNADASTRLTELKSEIEIPDGFWKAAPDFSIVCPRWSAAISQTNRDVGFRSHPLTFSEYLHDLLSNLAMQPELTHEGGVQ